MSLENHRIGVVIPTRNEAQALPRVLDAMPAFVTAVAIGDCRSSDGTPEIGRARGAIVVDEPRPGYGRACLSAIAALPPVDILVFVDGDAADDLTQMEQLIRPIIRGEADLVLGSRVLGEREPGALTPQQVMGNWLACTLIRLIWGLRFTDLGPFRAIRRSAYERLQMADENYGWTVEMQVKAAQQRLACIEIPARYRRRLGVSKVSGTLAGAVKAGVKILTVIGREAVRPSHRPAADRPARQAGP
jgi:glycosyltransferase involved in cell wall biosynthesis